MEPWVISVLCVAIFIFIMLLGVPVVYSLGIAAVVCGLIGYGPSVLPKVGWAPFSMLFNLAWTPLPLFVLMGSLIAETTMGEDLFKAASKWLSRVPGGLIASGIVGEAIMSAALGTSAATIIVMGKVAEQEFERYHYNKAFSFGALLAGGVLGPLIPPSATFIIYAVLTDTSLGHLFIAGIVPGILLTVMLVIPAILICWRRPQYGPPTGRFSWRERFASLKKIWAIILVMVCVLGVIYLGVATATESAGVGCVAVLLIGVLFFGLRWDGIRRALIDAATINGMILFIFVGASLFTYVLGSTNVAKYLLNFVHSSGLSRWWIMIAINIIYLILCCPLDELTVTFVTIPIFFPLIVSLGFDPVWFGIVFTVNTQLGLITPPLGIDLFAVTNVFKIPTGDLLRGVFPFFVILLIFLVIIIAFPQISLWLPNLMIGK